MKNYPPAQGLYNPSYEHDSCGVGFVAHIKGKAARSIVEQGLQVLCNVEHRGATGCETNTGDGAGILLQVPHAFLKRECSQLGFSLPEAGDYGLGMFYLPSDPDDCQASEAAISKVITEEGLQVLGWRAVPSDNSMLGSGARSIEPSIKQVFVGRTPDIEAGLPFERKLYVVRRCCKHAIQALNLKQSDYYYACSFSSRTVVYKGMLTPPQVAQYFTDLGDPEFKSAIALSHSRFSTNTFPNWQRSHPYRYIAHNGEINTLRGNVNWMRARQALLESDLLGKDLQKIFPIIDETGSDSGMFDNCLEFLALSGRSLPHAIMMMVPEPWAHHKEMDPEKKAFYEYHSCLMEPWDGPASIIFTDGLSIGAVLDRNGLRPSRYYITEDDIVVMGSEAGLVDLPQETVLEKGRLQPGQLFLIDTQKGCIISDQDLKKHIVSEQPYGQWLADKLVSLDDRPAAASPYQANSETLRQRQQAFGYTLEDLDSFLTPIAQRGVESVDSMGQDIPLAVLSNRPQLLTSYFKQLFAQVTNPPIDSIREAIITSTLTTLGSEGNLLQPTAESCRQVRLESPIISDNDLEKLRQFDEPGLKPETLPILFPAKDGAAGLENAIDALCQQADAAIDNGISLLILSDRGVDAENAPIPALLAVSGLHHHLIRQGTRTRVGLILESGEPRDVHSLAVLIGYGAGAINPYLALESLNGLIAEGLIKDIDQPTAVKNFVKATTKGVVKTMAKMGISTVQSYRGAQIFEAVGLDEAFVERFFTRTPSRVGGIGLQEATEEVLARHRHAFAEHKDALEELHPGGKHRWRSNGEHHLLSPQTIHKVQKATRVNSYSLFKEYTETVDKQTEQYCTLRGLMEIKFPEDGGIPIDEVEPVEAIVKRFKTGAMSYGSISKEAHEALAIAMNRLGGKSNTGEGGEDPERFQVMPNGDSKNSAIKQVASGRFGVTSHYLVNARELQIKMAQGAKPGEGGQLPGSKVYPSIAKVRHSTPGVGLISPPPHHDIYSIEDLAELIHDLKNANHKARISVKLVSEVGVGTIAAGVAKAHADVVLISGHDGGTGASPISSIHHAGLPWELGLAETHQTLLLNGLRDRIAVETDGQLKTGRDVVIATLLGAEEFGFATVPLVVLGCIMMRACHLNTCPVGVATQDPRLREKFNGAADHVVNFFTFIAQEVREYMARLGVRKLTDLIGRSNELLEMRKGVEHYKAKGLDFSKILYQPEVGPEVGRYCTQKQDHGLDHSLDQTTLLDLCRPAIENGESVQAEVPIKNINRVVGTLVGSELTRRHGPKGLPEDTVRLKFTGSAGQSFGAFIPSGLSLELEGDANDYFGKGLSGGKLILYPPKQAQFKAAENIIVGNVAFYGATAGEAYISGMAGERFCVRNSGVSAVVESIGDHGCEYMTGGRVVILGSTGRNFAAGMSGGIAYVLDTDGTLAHRCNPEMVGLEPLSDSDEIAELKTLIERHLEYTHSQRAQDVLDLWDEMLGKFVRVLPHDYKRMLGCITRAQESGLTGDQALTAAFEENIRDVSRVSGN